MWSGRWRISEDEETALRSLLVGGLRILSAIVVSGGRCWCCSSKGNAERCLDVRSKNQSDIFTGTSAKTETRLRQNRTTPCRETNTSSSAPIASLS